MADMNIEKIKTHPTFEGIFRIDQELLARIEQDMREGRYDISQPIILATWEGQKELVCIDGHTRLQAAKNAGIEKVPFFKHEFDTEQEAIEKAVKLQRNRRNMTDAEIIAVIEAIDRKKPRGGDRRSEEAKSKKSSDTIEKSGSKSAAGTAEKLGVSTTKVDRTRCVLNHGDPETIEAVKNGEMLINQACQETREKKSKRNKTNKTKPNSSTKNSKREATDECQEPRQGDTGTEVKETAPVVISMEQYRALFELGGSIEDHLASAIDLYLESLKEKNAQELAEKDQVAEGEQDHEDSDTDSTAADEEDHGESDDEYFDPDSYGNQDHHADEQPQDKEKHDESEENGGDEDDDEWFDPERDIDFDSFKED